MGQDGIRAKGGRFCAKGSGDKNAVDAFIGGDTRKSPLGVSPMPLRVLGTYESVFFTTSERFSRQSTEYG